MESTASVATPGKSLKKGRFLGWQNTPIHQATFGQTTRGGTQNTKFSLKHSTGKVQSVDSAWHVLDASEAPVGRLASVAATILMGKHRPTFTRGASSADSVVIINAKKAYFTSDKAEKKIYYWHTGYMGGLKNEVAKKTLSERPEEVIWQAVQGMLPKNKISRYQLARLKIYHGTDHPHVAQKPKVIDLKNKKLLMKLGA